MHTISFLFIPQYVEYEDMWVTEEEISDSLIDAFEQNIEDFEGKEIYNASSSGQGSDRGRLIKVDFYSSRKCITHDDDSGLTHRF